MATSRPRRANAGARMAQMLEAEEDEFYKNLYGGFTEDEEDKDFEISDQEGGDDEVDSDFDIDEHDEIREEFTEEDKASRRQGKRRLVTKAYKEPNKSKEHQDEKEKVVKKVKAAGSPNRSFTNRSFRETTKKKSEQTLQRVQQTKRKPKSQKDSKQTYHMTQEDLMREAKKTEEENLKSLEFHQKLELERLKRTKIIKKAIKGPFTRFLSMTMPLLDGDKVVGRCSRNFISFHGHDNTDPVH
ncbi:Vacuolar protein sorting-associated protein 72-like protein, partial [Fragariocoptes setiger]